MPLFVSPSMDREIVGLDARFLSGSAVQTIWERISLFVFAANRVLVKMLRRWADKHMAKIVLSVLCLHIKRKKDRKCYPAQ